MKFGKLQQIKFGTPSGAFSLVTDRENYDSQITLTDYEADLVINHFGKSNIHIGNVGSNKELASKPLRHYPTGKTVKLNIVFPKPEKTELRLYISSGAGFKPQGGEVWFLYVKSDEIWIGSMGATEWTKESSFLREDEEDTAYQQQLIEENAAKITKLKARDVYSRDRKIALARFDESNYRCEIDNDCRQFIARSTNKPYVEAHHLIPVSAQSQFDSSLDILENVFSLCPHCHRAIHHAERDVTIKMLETLSLKRPVLELHSLNLLDLTNLYGLEKLN